MVYSVGGVPPVFGSFVGCFVAISILGAREPGGRGGCNVDSPLFFPVQKLDWVVCRLGVLFLLNCMKPTRRVAPAMNLNLPRFMLVVNGLVAYASSPPPVFFSRGGRDETNREGGRSLTLWVVVTLVCPMPMS